jgi:hypothetical protein
VMKKVKMLRVNFEVNSVIDFLFFFSFPVSFGKRCLDIQA